MAACFSLAAAGAWTGCAEPARQRGPSPAGPRRTLAPAPPVQLPAPAPALPSAEAPPEPPPPDPGRANTDPSDDAVVGPPEPILDCSARLEQAGVRSRPGSIPVRQQAGGHVCGAEQVVVYEKGPSDAKWNAAPALTCPMALGLARFEAILQEEAERHLGARVARIVQGGTYSCRKMARFRLASEHSYANAIDIRGFVLDDGRHVTVKQHFGALGAEPNSAASRFLRSVAHRAFDEEVFSVVLTPYWDALHADHFHLDQARYRVDGSRAQESG